MSVIDSNLPIFHIVPSRPTPTTASTIAHSQNGSAPAPKYLKRRDPNTIDMYTVALHDSHYPDIVYAAVSAPAIYPPPNASNSSSKNRKPVASASGGSPSNDVSPQPPPDPPKVPAQITIELFNPDSRVILTQKPSSWTSGPYWEFSLPKTSFLQPTASKLDLSLAATQAALATLPVATFRWRKEGGVLSRSSLRCSLIHPNNVPLHDHDLAGSGTGVSSSEGGIRKPSLPTCSSEPDITIAILTNARSSNSPNSKPRKAELTIFESNLHRLEIEDLKGLEVTLLASAMAISDIYFGDMRTHFNLGARAPVNFSGPGKTASISLQQQVELAQADNEQRQRAVSNPLGQNTHPLLLRPGVNVSVTSSGGSTSPTFTAPPAYSGGSPDGSYPRDEKVRPTQEQLFNPAYQQRLKEEHLREQEAEARRLQRQFEEESARETARIEAETARLRAEFEREKAELEREGLQKQRRRRAWGAEGNGAGGGGGGSPVNGTGRRPYDAVNPVPMPPRPVPPSVTILSPAPQRPPRHGVGHAHSASYGSALGANAHHHLGGVNGYNLPNQNSGAHTLQPKKSGWFSGKRLDEQKDRRKSFMGLQIFGEDGGGGSAQGAGAVAQGKTKVKGRLEKKRSGMW
ncbi:hypothetical protein BDZ91DRAFT_225616 [Kalaharituber pfeilii]|nr:hypothetical protein BDZ91DRAFT_225616 [Kalaharituber pfeilii]